MQDWRFDLAKHLRGQKLVRKKYSLYSVTWDHDHCAACSAKFTDQDGPDHLHEGYATGPGYPKGEDYEWVCLQCFEDLKDDMGWTAE